jgi:Tol biopolymer transport system component
MTRFLALLVLCAAGCGPSDDAKSTAAGAAESKPYNDMFGAWSPDGSHIALTSDRTGDPEIYIARADGTALKQLTLEKGRDAHPFWSPDGTKIVFQSPRLEDVRIFFMNPDGSDQKVRLETRGFCGVPTWSPDGVHIAIMCSGSRLEPGTEIAPWIIHVMDAEGTWLRQVTEGEANDQVANWSPDSKRLIFFSNRTGTDQLYEIAFETGAIRQITDGPGSNKAASFSPDGETIVFMSDREGGRWDVHLMPAAGGEARRITDLGYEYGVPYFSPDGGSILIQTFPDKGARLAIIDVDGGNFRELEFRTGDK